MNKYLETRHKIACTGAKVVDDFLNHHGQHYETVGIETKIERLGDLLGRIADAANINLLEITDSFELSNLYSFDPNGTKSGWEE